MKRFVFTLLTLLLFVSGALAQSTSGRLIGTVSGPDGALPGATVTVVDDQSKNEKTVTASNEGAFTVTQLEAGTYTVTIKVNGFKTYTATGVKIDANRDYTMSPTLEVGGVNENVTVVAGADVINSSTGDLSSSVAPQQIKELPLDGRSPLSLIPLQAGTARATPGSVTSINGQRTSFTNLTRDGINVNDNFIRANATDFSPERASSDDTGEFTITTQNAGADQGYGAAQIQLVTPRGQTDYHGALYAYNRNSRFAANSFPNNAATPFIRRPYLNRNQDGGKISGPIPFTRKKMFVFFDFERQWLRQSQTNVSTVLTTAAKTGTFTFLDTANVTRTVNIFSLPVTAGAAGTPTAPTGISPVVQARLLSSMPAPNGAGGLNTGTFSQSQGFNDDYKYYTGRMDYDLNQRNSINMVYTFKREDLQRPDITLNSFGNIPPVTQPGINKFLSAGWTSTFSSNFSNEARGGFSFPTASFNVITPIPTFWLTTTLTNVPEANDFLNQGRSQHNYNMQDNASYTHGNHSFRFGAIAQIFRVKPYNDAGTVESFGLAVSQNSPQFTVANFATAGFAVSQGTVTTANSLFALLGGIIGSGQQSFNPTSATSGFAPTTLRQFYAFENYATYFNDQWRIKPNLTLNLGVRWEGNTALRIQNGINIEPIIPNGVSARAAILDPNGAYEVVGGNSGGKNRFYKDDMNNFAPVLSFAWSPTFKNGWMKKLLPGEGKTVIRGGFRMSYVPDQFLTAARNANGGNAGLSLTTLAALQTIGGTATSQLNLRADSPGTLPVIGAPAAPTFPRTFAFNNSASFSNFGTVFAVDPNLQTGREQEYSIGIQREIGKSAFEIRYVGSYAKNLIRGIDVNQVDILSNGFLADFNRAAANLALTGNAFCTTAGCQTLTIFGQTATSRIRVGPAAGGVALATFNAALGGGIVGAGVPGNLALSILQANADFNPNIANGQFPLVPNTNTGAADLLFNGARDYYNSMQVEFRRRFSQGFSFQANYTFAKNLTDAVGTAQALLDPFLDNAHPELDYSRADFDQTHSFNFNGIYELPFGKGKHFLNESGIVDKVFGGFQLSSIVHIGTGRPVSLADPRGTLNRSARATRQTPNSNLTKSQIKDLFGRFLYHGTFQDVLMYINPAVLNITQTRNATTGVVTTTSLATNGPGQPTFANQAFFNVGPGQTGNMERGFINGPRQFTMDAAIVKKIRFTETKLIELRMEAFNLTNHNNYLLPLQIDINSTTFGQLTTARSEQAQGLDSPRRMQFAVRFEF
jgi:hypothetical protein